MTTRELERLSDLLVKLHIDTDRHEHRQLEDIDHVIGIVLGRLGVPAS